MLLDQKCDLSQERLENIHASMTEPALVSSVFLEVSVTTLATALDVGA
jgi:hypothetical protein